MLRFAIVLTLLFVGPAHPAHAQDISYVAASPYDLAKFVETHSNFDWNTASRGSE